MTILRAGSRLFCHDARKNSSHPCKCRPRMAGEVCHPPYEGDAIGENSRASASTRGRVAPHARSANREPGAGRSTAWRFCREIISTLGYRRRPSIECSPLSNFPRPREKYFWSTSRRNWRALMGRTKRSFASFVVRLPRLSKFIVAARQATRRRAAFIHPGTSAGLDYRRAAPKSARSLGFRGSLIK